MGSTQLSDVERALAFYNEGKLPRAEKLLKKAMRDRRYRPDCLHLLGMIAFQRGRFDLAVRQIGQAVAAQPENPTFLCNLGAAQLEAGAVPDSISSYQRAIDIRPQYPQALANLGLAYEKLGEFTNAEAAHRRVIEIEPENPTAHFNLANSLIGQERSSEAIDAFEAAIQRNADYGEARSNLASAHRARGDFEAALSQLVEAVRRDPDSFALRYNLADTLHQAGRLEAAREHYMQAISLNPDTMEARINLAALLVDLAQPGQAIELYRACCRMRPRDASLRGSLASLLEQVNLMPEATTHLNAGLKLAPDDGYLRLLAARFSRREGDIEAAREQLKALLDDPLPADVEAEAAVELGIVLDRVGDFGQAFETTERGQRIAASLGDRRDYDLANYRRSIHENGQWFSRERVAQSAPAISGTTQPDPIFFVGFPRSGTTLVEQILASHPEVVTTAEAGLLSGTIDLARRLDTWQTPYPEFLARLSHDQMIALREHYWQHARSLTPTDSLRVVDKLPLNLIHLGFVRWIFPKAKILVALRDPRDVAISCFMQSFRPNVAMAHFSSIETTADLYAAVMELWLHFRDQLGLDWLAYRYEDLVADPESVVREIIGHLELPWSEELRDHTKVARERHIATPSYADVMQPVYSRAIGRWKNYRAQLEPILPKLERFVAEFGYEPS